MRHSRRAKFVEAVSGPAPSASHWSDVASDPNDPRALVHRARVLHEAWRAPIDNRIGFIEDRCSGKKVLDVGCVAHDVERMASPNWLHGRVAAVANRCVGVDVLASGLEEMDRRGYEVVLHDLTTGLGPIADLAPFEVIIAGELVEHVERLDMLFTLARNALSADGQLILTTPNPYAPARVRAGQLGIIWENVDHIAYAFPSGIAELCERHGLRLSEAAVTSDVPARVGVSRMLRRLVLGTRWVDAGYATKGALRHVRVDYRLPLPRFRSWFIGRRPFLGETFIYVVGAAARIRPAKSAPAV